MEEERGRGKEQREKHGEKRGGGVGGDGGVRAQPSLTVIKRRGGGAEEGTRAGKGAREGRRGRDIIIVISHWQLVWSWDINCSSSRWPVNDKVLMSTWLRASAFVIALFTVLGL